MKMCNVCSEEKPLQEFARNGRNRHRSQCKSCWNPAHNRARREQRKRNSDERTRKAPEYLVMHRDARLRSYRDVLYRMYDLELMSDEFFQDALARVDEMEKTRA